MDGTEDAFKEYIYKPLWAQSPIYETRLGMGPAATIPFPPIFINSSLHRSTVRSGLESAASCWRSN